VNHPRVSLTAAYRNMAMKWYLYPSKVFDDTILSCTKKPTSYEYRCFLLHKLAKNNTYVRYMSDDLALLVNSLFVPNA
jgi:hypothetical protein